MLQKKIPHVHEISPGKNAVFLSIYLPHLQDWPRIVLGFSLCGNLTRLLPALYVISVRQTRDLPPASFRFHLTVDTLALSYVLGTINPHSGLSPVRLRPCRAHHKKKMLAERASIFCITTLLPYVSIN